MSGKETRALPGEKETTRWNGSNQGGSGMESQLLERIYTRHPVLSMHRTESTNVTAIEFMHIYTRFQLGRATAQDRQWFVWDSGMTPEAFHDKNNFNLIEPVYEVIQ